MSYRGLRRTKFGAVRSVRTVSNPDNVTKSANLNLNQIVIIFDKGPRTNFQASAPNSSAIKPDAEYYRDIRDQDIRMTADITG